MSKIIPIEKSETVDYGDVEHKNFWLKRDVSEIQSFTSERADFHSSDGVICVASENITDHQIIRGLFESAQRGCKVYILVNSISREMDGLRKSCLIIESKGNIGSFILNVNEKTGFFWNGQLTEESINFSSTLFLTLNDEQTRILYRHFCYHFWRSIPDSPMDIFPNLDNFCDGDFVQSEISGRKEIAFVSAVQSEIESSKIITSLKGNNNSYIPQIAEKGTKIVALKKGNSINLIENDDGAMFVIPKANIAADDILWALKLNNAQKNQVKKYLQNVEENADYEFCISKTRAELKDRRIMPLEESNDVHIAPMETKTLAENVSKEFSNKEEFENRKPVFTDDGKSVQITYKWKNVPFYLPQDAKKHILYANWDSEIKKIRDYLDGILQKVETAEKKESSVAKALAHFFLGKKTRFGSLKTEIINLKTFEFAKAKSDKLKDRINRINEISRQVANDITEIDDENRKAKIDEEIERYKEKIVVNEETLKKLEDTRNDRKAKNNEEIAGIKNEIAAKEERLKKLENEIARIKEETAKKTKEEKTDEKSTTESQKDTVAVDSDIQLDIDKIKTEIKKLNSDEKQKNMDITAMENKFQSDVNKIKNDIKQSQTEIGRLEKSKNHTAAPQNKESSLSALSKNKNQNENKSELAIPKPLYLPEIGTLYQVGGNNGSGYLAIDDWDKFDLGKQEAIRLSAKLCVERG